MGLHESQIGRTESSAGEQKLASLGLIELIGLDMSSTTKNGRLLSENSAPPSARFTAISSGIPMQMVTCPYPDSRTGLQMHVSAMEAMQDHWQELQHGLAWIHANYFRGNPPSNVKLRDAIGLTLTAEKAVHYVTKRAKNPYASHGALPDEIGSLYKLSRGVLAPLLRQPRNLSKPITPADIYTFANSHELLTRNGEACAAPPRRIITVLETLFYGEHGNPNASEFATYFPDPNALLAYAKAVGWLEVNNDDEKTQLAAISTRIQQVVDGDLSDRRKSQALRTYAADYRNRLQILYAQASQAYIAGNVALGREKPKDKLTMDTIRDMLPNVLSEEVLTTLTKFYK